MKMYSPTGLVLTLSSSLTPLPTVLSTEWQWPLSGVHSHHDDKNQPSLVRVGGGARSPPFTLSTIIKVVVYAPAETADTLPLFLLYPLYVLCGPVLSPLKQSWNN
jgi:hypothetical protein